MSSAAPARIVLLGATGFVGSAVLRELAARPVHIRAVARRPTAVPPGAVADIETCTADLTVPGELAAAVADADVIVLATLYRAAAGWRVEEGDPAAERVNVGLVRDLVGLLAATGAVPKVVFTGAVSQVGPIDKETLDGSESDHPVGAYDRQKLTAERLLLDAAARGVLCGVSLRLPTVFGHVPGTSAADRGIVSGMARRALAGDPLTMWHDGTVGRDLLPVEDVARAVGAAIDHAAELTGRHWLIGTGRSRSLGPVLTRVAELVAEHTGKPPVPVVSVEPPAYAEAGDFRSVAVDASAFRAVTGWEARIPFDEALRRTVGHLAATETQLGLGRQVREEAR
ncbi:NAD-dependent epimerase/dehydratase family protein [Streptomyces tubercidicus]|uniref:NAD-dependent epimerase/dehydratase family protein n=1 Tax=Streptomyces tubercidicus TaxID=47759 RepID=UPI0034657284